MAFVDRRICLRSNGVQIHACNPKAQNGLPRMRRRLAIGSVGIPYKDNEKDSAHRW
jgi:hypothetical protein